MDDADRLSAEQFPPASYIRTSGGGAHKIVYVQVSARAARKLTQALRVREYERLHRGEDPELDSVLAALGYAGLVWASSESGTTDAIAPHADRRSEWQGTVEAAGRLGMSERGVRKACATGRLPAQLVGGRWVMRPEDIARYREQRAA